MSRRFPVRISLLAVLALAAVLAGCRADPSASLAASPEPVAPVAVAVADFEIRPPELRAAGPNVSLVVSNEGPTPHNLTIRDAGGQVLAATADLRRGASESISVELNDGAYVTFCSLAGHESLGMRGTLVVGSP